MHTAATADPIATLRAEMRAVAAQPTPARLWRSLADAWLRPLEQLAVVDVRGVDRGMPDDHLRAARD